MMKKIKFQSRVAGVLYEFELKDLFRCATCHRQTLSGLCGCDFADPILVDKALYGIPIRSIGDEDDILT